MASSIRSYLRNSARYASSQRAFVDLHIQAESFGGLEKSYPMRVILRLD